MFLSWVKRFNKIQCSFIIKKHWVSERCDAGEERRVCWAALTLAVFLLEKIKCDLHLFPRTKISSTGVKGLNGKANFLLILGENTETFLCEQKMEKDFLTETFKNANALTAVVQRVRRHPADWKFTCSIQGQGTCLGCGPWGHATWWDISLPLFLHPFPLSKNK